MNASEIRQKINRFRILIIGRANAGKTTILKRVCNTQENPEIYNSAGEKIDPAVLMASRERGVHNIENEMVFRSNPGFVFHDSRGFEAGGQFEFDKVKAFIASRSKERRLNDRIHVIWYCIPMDEDGRSFTEAEVKFFSQCNTGSIAVIALFTKFDALYDDEFAELISEGVSRTDAHALASQHAKEAFANGPQLKLLYNRKGNQRPPRCHICLPDMDKDDADCGILIEWTAKTLDNDMLKQMFVSTQRRSLELCMEYAVKKTLARHLDFFKTISSRRSGTSDYQIVDDLGQWFPHLLIRFFDEFDFRELPRRDGWWWHVHGGGRPYHYRPEEDQMWSRLRLGSSPSGSSTLEEIVQLGSAVVIIFENAFYLSGQQHLTRQESVYHPVRVALQQYMASPNAAAVREALSSAIRTYETDFSHRIPGSPKYFQKKAELIGTIFEIVLQHRLPTPQV